MTEIYTSQQRLEVIKINYRNSESKLRVQRLIYSRNNHPSRSAIERLVEKFEFTGTVQNVSRRVSVTTL